MKPIMAARSAIYVPSRLLTGASALILMLALAVLLPAGLSPAAAWDEDPEEYDWYQLGYEKGQYDAMYGRPDNPDYWDNNGSQDYYDGYDAGYESVNYRDWFAEGLANGRADREQGYPYQPLAWPNDGSPNYYAGYDSGYKGTPIDWYNAGWYNGLNDGRNGMLYSPDIYYSNHSQAYYEGYYDGYYGSYDANAKPPGPEEQNDNDAHANTNSSTNADLDNGEANSDTASVPEAAALSSSFMVDSPECIIEGRAVSMDAAPYAAGNRVFVPLRYLAYMCGLEDGNILWDAAARKVVLQKPGGPTLVFTLDVAGCQVDGQFLALENAPEVRGGRVYLPARPVAENLGYAVQWDGASRTVSVASNK